MSRRRERFLRPARAGMWCVCVLLGAALNTGCGVSSRATDYPYESCSPGDYCTGGLACADTTLPISSGYSGSFCTSTCNTGADCLQVPQNFSAECVNAQCYLTCPTGGESCPYSQGCFTFASNAGLISLCTP